MYRVITDPIITCHQEHGILLFEPLKRQSKDTPYILLEGPKNSLQETLFNYPDTQIIGYTKASHEAYAAYIIKTSHPENFHNFLCLNSTSLLLKDSFS